VVKIIFAFALFNHRTEYILFPHFSTPIFLPFFHHEEREGTRSISLLFFFFVFLCVLRGLTFFNNKFLCGLPAFYPPLAEWRGFSPLF